MEYEVETTTAPVGYELEIGEFRGPLDKLLELIDEKKLEITRLNLAQVTADFIEYLRTLEEVEHRELADFVVIAAKLVLLKSHALLPDIELSEEEEKDIADLEKRLKLYKEFRQVEKNILELWGKHRTVARPFFATVPHGFYLTEEISPKKLHWHLGQLVQATEELVHLETKRTEIINLEDKITELLQRVKSLIQTNFAKLKGQGGKSETVVLFLALLYLLRDNKINIAQENIFGDITISDANRKS
jgi:segregation and condensation protein A